MLTLLVYWQQGNLEKSKKLMKIVITGGKTSSYLPYKLSSFNKTFKKGVPYDNIKSHKKTGLYPFSKNHSFEKPAF